MKINDEENKEGNHVEEPSNEIEKTNDDALIKNGEKINDNKKNENNILVEQPYVEDEKNDDNIFIEMMRKSMMLMILVVNKRKI